MARYTLAVEEYELKEVIKVIRAGLGLIEVDYGVTSLLEGWCDDNEASIDDSG